MNQYHAKVMPKRFQSIKCYWQNLNVRFRVATYYRLRRISSHRFSSAKRSDNLIYICVCRLGLPLFKKKKLTFHWPCISQFSSVFWQVIDILYFFPQHMVMVKRISRQRKWLSLKGLLTFFYLTFHWLLPRFTIFNDFRKPCFC